MNRLEKIRLAYGSTLMDGGYTLWNDGQKRDKGFVVGGVDREQMCDKHDFFEFAKLYDNYTKIASNPTWLILVGMGTWTHQGQIHFDVVEHCEDEDVARNKCVERGELAYYDLEKKKSVYIETPES